MQSYSKYNVGHKYILIVTDTYTKYLWIQALKNKSSKQVTQGMLSILNINHPKFLQTYNGTEFYNKLFQNLTRKYNIKQYSTYSGIKAAIKCTIKNIIYKKFTVTGSYDCYCLISNIVYNYNNTKHTTIKYTSHEARTVYKTTIT
uniref:Pro-Pol polyprotein n=1 Tax=Sipha flava TaxID=143950 RepID=A0A2S2R3G8_9HEMI